MKFLDDNGALVFYHNGEMGRIEAWVRILSEYVPPCLVSLMEMTGH